MRFNQKDLSSGSILAAYWFHRGAESGLRLSMLSLPHIYENGEGVKQDPAIADYWRDRASQTIDPEIDGGSASSSYFDGNDFDGGAA